MKQLNSKKDPDRFINNALQHLAEYKFTIVWNLDIIEKIESFRGHKYCLIMTCALTGFTILEPLFIKEAVEVAWNFLRIVGICGKSTQIGSDMGSEFISNILKQIKETFNIEHIYAIVENHKSNGLPEIKIKLAREMMNKFVEKYKLNPRDWDLTTYMVNLGMNARQNANYLLSSYQFAFGTNPIKNKEYKGGHYNMT